MKTSTKIGLITATALMAAGAVIFIGGMSLLNWDISRLSTTKLVANTYEVSGVFDDLRIEAKTDDVSFQLSDDNTCKIVCREQEKMKHAAELRDRTLTVSVTDTREWYEHIGLFWADTPKTTVYLPQNRYASLSVETATGNVSIPGSFTFDSIDVKGATGNLDCAASVTGTASVRLSTGNIVLDGVAAGEMRLTTSTGGIRVNASSCRGDLTTEVSTGPVVLRDVKCGRLLSKGSTGNLVLEQVLAAQTFTLNRSTGDVTLTDCDAGGLFIKTSTGNVTSTLLSEKVFVTDTSTGTVRVPQTAGGGKCEVTTSTGNILLAVKGS